MTTKMTANGVSITTTPGAEQPLARRPYGMRGKYSQRVQTTP